MRFVLYFFLAFFIIGCNSAEQRFDPYKKQIVQNDKEFELKKLQSDSQLELARIQAQNELALKSIEAQNNLDVANVQKDVSLKEQDVILKTQDDKNATNQIIAFLVAIVVIVLLLVFTYINQKNRQMKLQIRQEEIQKERDLHKEACYNERVNKILEIVASNNTDKQIKEQLVDILKHSKPNDPLIEHKK